MKPFVTPVEPVAVQPRVHVVSTDPFAERGCPRVAVALVVRVPALTTRPVTGRKGNRLVVEEQRRVAPWLPPWRTPPAELEHARDPALAVPRAHDVVASVQAAAIPHEHAPLVGATMMSPYGVTRLRSGMVLLRRAR